LAQGTVYKSVFKNAAYIFFIKLFPAIASIIILIVFSRKLPADVYGRYQDFWVKLLLIGTLAYAGLPVTIITYSASILRQLARQISPRHVLLYLIWFFASLAAFAFFLKQHQLPLLLLFGVLLSYVVHAVQEALVMASAKMRGLLVANTAYALYFLAVHLYFLEDFHLLQLWWWLVLGMAVRALFLSAIIFAIYKPVAPVEIATVDQRKARNLWLHLGFYDLIQTAFRYGDKFILASVLTANVFAIYFNGSQAADVPLLPYLLGAVASALLIQLSGDAADPSKSYKLLRASGIILSGVVFPLFFFLWFYATEIFTLVFTEKYLTSVPVFLVALLVLPLRAYSFTTLLQHLHQGAIINKGAVLDLLLALAMMYPFYLVFGLPGVPLAFVLSTYVQVGYYLWQTSRLTGVSVRKMLPLKNWVVRFAGFGVITWLLHTGLHSILDGGFPLLAGFVSTAVLMLLSVWYSMRRLNR